MNRQLLVITLALLALNRECSSSYIGSRGGYAVFPKTVLEADRGVTADEVVTTILPEAPSPAVGEDNREAFPEASTPFVSPSVEVDFNSATPEAPTPDIAPSGNDEALASSSPPTEITTPELTTHEPTVKYDHHHHHHHHDEERKDEDKHIHKEKKGHKKHEEDDEHEEDAEHEEDEEHKEDDKDKKHSSEEHDYDDYDHLHFFLMPNPSPPVYKPFGNPFITKPSVMYQPVPSPFSFKPKPVNGPVFYPHSPQFYKPRY